MPDFRPPSSAGSDADFDLARRAVEAGLLSEEQVETALIAQEKDPSRRLLELLPLPPESLRALRRHLPAEVAEAMKDVSKRFGDYWLVTKVSEGGMGEVYRAWDGRLGRWVAIKVPKRPESGEARMYFEREASIIAGLDHPNIAKVFEVGENEGKPFLAMQLIDGKTLDDAGPEVAREQRLRWVRDAAAAVGAAHAAGVIHRDIKPSNVMVGPDGHVFVLDFGLAKPFEIADGSVGGSRLIVGTPNYMSPEQALGKADTRSDIYGLGGILYELVTGRPPFLGENATEVILQVVDRDPIPPRKLDPGASRDLEAIVLKCLEKDPARRYADVPALLEDIDACLAGAALRHARRRTALYVLGRQIRRQPLLWSIGALASLLAIAFAGAGSWWYFKPGTLRLRVFPAGATVTVEGRTWKTGGESLDIVLSQGAHAVRVEAPGYEPATPVVLVTREIEVLPVALRHERGLLEMSLDPSTAKLEVDGLPFGAPELDSGRHALLAWAPGCFDIRRTIDIPAGGRARADFGLESGEIWRFRSDAIQSACTVFAITDIDGDGTPDLAVQELRDVAFVSGANGALLRRQTVAGSASWNIEILDLRGNVGRVLAAHSDGEEGLRIDLFDLAPGAGGRLRFSWTEPGASRSAPQGAELRCGPDLDGDGVAELVIGAHKGNLWVVNVARGEARPIRSGDAEFHAPRFGIDGDHVVFSGLSGPGDKPSGRRYLGAISARDGSVAWSRTGEWDWTMTADLEGAGHFAVLAGHADRVDLFDGLSGALARTLPLSFPGILVSVPAARPGCPAQLLLAGDRDTAALDPADGRIRWHIRSLLAQTPVFLTGDVLLVPTAEALLAINCDSGRVLWKTEEAPEGCLVRDIDRDGRAEVLFGVAGVGIRCLSGEGAALWTLRLKGSPRPLQSLETGEELRIVFGRRSSFVGMARSPRELWHADALGPFLAGPVAVTSGAGPVVFQAGDWGQDRWLRGFDGRTGDAARTFAGHTPPNNPPLLTDWDGDRRPEILAWVEQGGSANAGLEILATSGEPVCPRFEGPGFTDVYATPAAADLDGDGTLDVALTRRLAGDAIAWSGKDGRILWRVDLKAFSWGGPAVADFDGDGRPDVLAAADGQPLRALHGSNGALVWEAPVGGGVRHVPVLAKLNGDEAPDVLAMTIDGELVALDGRTGGRLAAVVCAEPGAGGFCVAPRPGGGLVVLASLGSRGVAAFAWPGLERVWTTPIPAHAAPVAGDLDEDGRWEVVATASRGTVEVLDLATGKALWSHSLSPEGCIAPPALADLDGDGILDILAADRGGRLTAVSGRPTRASRK